MEKNTFYITTPIFYPNANLHMGHAYTITVCDILARANKLQGKDVYFLTGSDENTGKILGSLKEEQTLEDYLVGVTDAFKDLYGKLDVSYDQFIRTSDKNKHWPGAIALWNKLTEAGDIYKSKYIGLYCVGCETFYTEKDLVDGKCPVHLTVPEKIEEENYFFRLSKYTNIIKEKIQSNELAIVPETRKNEILALLERGLEDISFSRPLKSVPHGIPVPNDPEQVMYVWCDALTNYISALGYGRDDELFKKFWPANVQVIGKDILRFHAGIWPAMLLSAGLPLPKSLLVHGLITSGGQKMSKSLGNVVSPYDLINEYGADAVRYYLAREVSTFEDGDLTLEKFKEAYNANLANGLGNLVARVMRMASGLSYEVQSTIYDEFEDEYKKAFEDFNIQKVGDYVWRKISSADKKIQETTPFKLVKEDSTREEGQKIIIDLVKDVYLISELLTPIIPETSRKIQEAIKENRMPETLFPRKD
jgi:methionyl-tRNA synthetase